MRDMISDPTMTALIGAAVMIVMLILLVVLRWEKPKPALVICGGCGNFGHARTVTPGSPVMSFVLFFAAIIPGIFYMLWRQTARHDECSVCSSRDIVPPDSPRGIELQERYHAPKVAQPFQG